MCVFQARDGPFLRTVGISTFFNFVLNSHFENVSDYGSHAGSSRKLWQTQISRFSCVQCTNPALPTSWRTLQRTDLYRINLFAFMFLLQCGRLDACNRTMQRTFQLICNYCHTACPYFWSAIQCESGRRPPVSSQWWLRQNCFLCYSLWLYT